MDHNGTGFMYLTDKFSRISDAKIKDRVFVGLQIREFIQDVKFEDHLTEVQKSSVEIIQKYHYHFFFLRNHKAQN
jgi:hypothetical protein